MAILEEDIFGRSPFQGGVYFHVYCRSYRICELCWSLCSRMVKCRTTVEVVRTTAKSVPDNCKLTGTLANFLIRFLEVWRLCCKTEHIRAIDTCELTLIIREGYKFWREL